MWRSEQCDTQNEVPRQWFWIISHPLTWRKLSKSITLNGNTLSFNSHHIVCPKPPAVLLGCHQLWQSRAIILQKLFTGISQKLENFSPTLCVGACTAFECAWNVCKLVPIQRNSTKRIWTTEYRLTNFRIINTSSEWNSVKKDKQ